MRLHDLRDVGGRQARRVLGRQDDRGGAHRHAVLVLDRDLALGVGLQPLVAAVADLSQALQDVVAVLQGRRHQLGRLVRGVAEHDALVARALVLVPGGVDADRDVGRLAVQTVDELELVPVETRLFVADVADRGAHGGLDLILHARGPLPVDVHDALTTNLAGQHDQIGRRQRLAGHPRIGVLGQEQVHDGVGDPVRDLVGMTLGDAFRGEKEVGTGQGGAPGGRTAARHIKICLYVQGLARGRHAV